MKRKIIEINEERCNGCGLCAKACHEGAIEMVNGKAKLISDEYCDGLGDCLPACPTDAISIVERESKPFDKEAVEKRMMSKKNKGTGCSCPSTMAKKINREKENNKGEEKSNIIKENALPDSQLNQWPVQLRLVNPNASYFEEANLLIAADCTAFAYGNFHNDFIKDHITLIFCPKLDNIDGYVEKLTEILTNNSIKSITAVRMQVPCCGGTVNLIKQAMLASEKIVPYNEVIISTDGKIIK